MIRTQWIACCMLTLALPQAYGAAPPDKVEILKRARQSYYSLQQEGMAQFQCTTTVNWDYTLEDLRKSNPSGFATATRIFKPLRFLITHSLNGHTSVTHNELQAENEQQAQGFKQMYEGMDQAMTGFFESWNAFAVHIPLPDPSSEFQLEDREAGYLVSYKDGGADIATDMGKNFAITQLKVSAQSFSSTIEPKFNRSNKGFILSSYHAYYRNATGADATELQVWIDYQDVDHLKLPQRLRLTGSYSGTPFKMEVLFSACQASRT